MAWQIWFPREGSVPGLLIAGFLLCPHMVVVGEGQGWVAEKGGRQRERLVGRRVLWPFFL